MSENIQYIKNNQFNCFKEYQSFKTLPSFNKSFANQMTLHKHLFSKKELLVIKEIKNMAAKIPGVCFAKIETVLELLSEQYGEKSPSYATAKRAISKAKKVGIFTVVRLRASKKAIESKKLLSNNLYVFNAYIGSDLVSQMTSKISSKTKMSPHKMSPHKQGEKPVDKQSEGTKNGSYTSFSSYTSLNNIDIRKAAPSLGKEFVSSKIPSFVKDFIAPAFNSAKIIEECYYNAKNIFTKQNKLYTDDYKMDESEFDRMARDASKCLAKKESSLQKIGKSLEKPVGYFTNTFINLVDELEWKICIENNEKSVADSEKKYDQGKDMHNWVETC